MHLSKGGHENVGSACTSNCQPKCYRFYKWAKEDRGIRSAQLLFTVALVLEFIATLWAFNQARAAGALYGNVECEMYSRLERFYASEVVQQQCQQLDLRSDASLLETLWADGYAFCEDLAEPPAQEDSFLERCGCDEDSKNGSYSGGMTIDGEFVPWQDVECRWIGVEDKRHGLCFADSFPIVSCADDDRDSADCYGGIYLVPTTALRYRGCWAKNPSGTLTITILTTAVALVGQVTEAIVARREFKNPQKVPVLMTAASVFQAVGVVVVTVVLLTRPGFAKPGYWGLHRDEKVLIGFAISAAVTATLGGLAEALSCHLKFRCQKLDSEDTPRPSGTSRNAVVRWFLDDTRLQHGRMHFLGVLGNAAIWLGVAVSEVIVATYLVWKGQGLIANSDDYFKNKPGDWSVFRASLASLLAIELLALMAMWIAKYLWHITKFHILVEPYDFPVRVGGLVNRQVGAKIRD